MKYWILVLVSLFLLSCSSTKYTGTNQPELVKNSCSLKAVVCKRYNENLNIQYQVEKVSANTYVIEGFAVFNTTQEFNRYDTVDSMELEFVFLNKNLAVHEENILLHGVLEKKLVFKKKFTSEKTINSSILVDVHTVVGLFG